MDYNVNDIAFGGTGLGHDGQSINTTIAAAALTEGTVVFPPGTYSIDEVITVPSGVALRSASGLPDVKLLATASVNYMLDIAADSTGNTIENLTFDGNDYVELGLLRVGGSVRDCSIKHCAFKRGPNQIHSGAIGFQLTGNQENIQIKRNHFFDTHRCISIFAPTYNVAILENRFFNITPAAIYIVISELAGQTYLSRGLQIVGNRMWDFMDPPRDAPIELKASLSTKQSLHPRSVFHLHPHIEGNEIIGKAGTFYPSNATNWSRPVRTHTKIHGTQEMYRITDSVLNATIINNVALHSGDCGFTLACKGSKIVGNHAEGCDHAGIFCAGHENLIANNVCLANGKRYDGGGTGPEGYARSGIVINGTYHTIMNNTCVEDGRYPKGALQSWGIQLRAKQTDPFLPAAEYNTLIDNICKGNQNGDVYDWKSST